MLKYTETFKASNLETESDSIQLSDSSWIETSKDYIGTPSAFSPHIFAFCRTDSDPNYDLSKFSKPLIDSPTRLRTESTQEQQEKNPLSLHECSHIAIALAIMCDSNFVCGIESFSNSKAPENPSIGPHMSYFQGENSVATIVHSDEHDLLAAYQFVYHTFAERSWVNEDGKLLSFFLKCIVRHPYQRFTVLKIGLDHLFTEWDATILNSALFFEHLLTNESDDRKTGVKVWNRIFDDSAFIDANMIDIIFNFRHIVAHVNPTRAKEKIDQWVSHLSDDDKHAAMQKLRKDIWRTARSCVRARILEPEKFKLFLESRPN